jgi:hypothetical protein
MHECFSDASCLRIGAFSNHDKFDFRWHLTHEDLVQAGFDMKAIDEDAGEPKGTSDQLHINVLEFFIASNDH